MRQLAIVFLLGMGCANVTAATVVVGDKTWRQVTETTNLTWNEVAAVCNGSSGVCAGSVGAVSFSGWTWAATDDVRYLFEALISPATTEFPTSTSDYYAPAPSYSNADIDAAIGASMFNATFTNTDRRSLVGFVRDAASSSHGYYSYLNSWAPSGQYFYQDNAVNAVQISNTNRDTGIGVWLYQTPAPSAVPVPAAVWLLLSGLGGVGAFTRRRKSALAA